MSRACDAIGCGTPTASGRFMCLRHWRLVPQDLQRTINTRFRAGREGFAFLSDVLYLQAAVDAVAAIAVAEGKEGANPYTRHLVLAARRQGLSFCERCQLPITPGQAHHGATKNHWHCEQQVALDAKQAIANGEKALEKAKAAVHALAGKGRPEGGL